jgi:Carboxypeptidase regulatory-like domain/Putative zinc-finger
MSDPLQPGQHPDADQLSAFAEHALPAHEYERTLAHLAVCPDCRSVVALSMPPMPEAEQPQPNVVRKPWFSSWKFALPLTAAAVALTVVVVENRINATRQHRSVLTQEAELHSTSAVPPPSASVPVPAAKPSVSLSSNAKPQRPPAQSAGTTNLNGAIGTKSQSTAARATESEAQNLALHGAAVVNGRLPNSFGGIVGGISAANNAPSPKNPSPNNGHPLQQSLFNGDASAPPPQPAAPTAITGAVAGQVPQPGDTAASLPATSAAPVATASQAAFAAAPMVTARNRASSAPGASPDVLAQTSLPSHLPAISLVSVAHRKLAIDTRNTLFLSTDDGKNWKAVSAQWQGHAISVALVSSSPFTRPAPAVPTARGTSIASSTPQTGLSSVQLQTAGSTLAGTITDPSGAVIPNADVTVTRNGTSDSRTVKTDQEGNYTVNHLAPDDYQIAARAVGFVEQISTLNIVASEPLRANFSLPIGAASETVEVSAASASIPLIESPRAAKKIATPSTNFPALPVFEMTTAEGEHWTSVDGQTWKRK